MRLGAWVMISPTFPPRRQQRESLVFSRITRSLACGKHGCHDRPEAEPRPCGVRRPRRAMPDAGRPRWPPQSLVEIGASSPAPAQRWPADLRRPQRADSLGLQQFHLHDQLPDPLHGDVQFRLRSPLRSLSAHRSRRVTPARAGKSPRPTPSKSSTGIATQKPQGNLTLAVAVHRWPSPSGPAGESPGKTLTAKLAPFTTGSTATLFSKLSFVIFIVGIY